MSLHGPMRRWAAAAAVILLAVIAGPPPARAIEPRTGARNFTAPGYVPDYFSNESGPFHSRSGVRPAPAVSVPAFVASAPSTRQEAPAPEHVRRAYVRHRTHAQKGVHRGHRRATPRAATHHHHVAHARVARHGRRAASRTASAHHRGATRSKATARHGRAAPQHRRIAQAHR